MATTTNKPSPADIITNTIIDKLEAGVRPWVKPWRPGLGGRPLRATGDPYKGINCFWLWLCAESAGYNSRTWMTYKQAQALARVERLADECRFVGHVTLFGLHPPTRDHDLDVGPVLVDVPGQGESIHVARHVDV